MRLIIHSFPFWKANQGWYINGQHTWARRAEHVKDILDRDEHTDGRLLGIRTNNPSSKYSMTCALWSTLQVSGLELPALRNPIPCMVHIIQLALDAFMCSLGLKHRTKFWEAHERVQQSGENQSIHFGKSQWLRKEGNATINRVAAIRPSLAKIIEKVCISRHVESPKINLHRAENACCSHYAYPMSSKCVVWLS